MVLLEDIMICVANPREGAQDGNDDEDVGDNAAHQDSRMLHSAMPNDIDNLKDQPTV
jgi:hypothetical protein